MADSPGGKKPDEDEVQKWVAQLEEDRRRIEAPGRALSKLAASLTTSNVAMEAAAAVTFTVPAFEIPDPMAGLWDREDPTGAKREACRRVYGFVPFMPYEMYLLPLGARSALPAIAANEPPVAIPSAEAPEPMGVTTSPAAATREASPPNTGSSPQAPTPGSLPKKLTEETRRILAIWVQMGRPKVTAQVADHIAEQVFPREFAKTKKGNPGRRKLHDRIRVAIRRYESVAGQL